VWAPDYLRVRAQHRRTAPSRSPTLINEAAGAICFFAYNSVKNQLSTSTGSSSFTEPSSIPSTRVGIRPAVDLGSRDLTYYRFLLPTARVRSSAGCSMSAPVSALRRKGCSDVGSESLSPTSPACPPETPCYSVDESNALEQRL
jgi:hypothetical protein